MKTGENGNYSVMKTIFQSMGDCDLHEKKSGRFVYTFYLKDSMKAMEIEHLELSVRAYNGLKRAGYHTVGQLAEDLANGVDLRKVRNCGAKTYAEIAEKLFLLNLLGIPEKKREEYLLNIVEKNRKEPV